MCVTQVCCWENTLLSGKDQPNDGAPDSDPAEPGSETQGYFMQMILFIIKISLIRFFGSDLINKK